MQNAEMTINERLRHARQNAGFDSAADAARRLKIPYGTYSGHENGSRGIKRDDVIRYARAFGVSRIWLEFGEDPKFFGMETVEILGEVGKLPSTEIVWHTDPSASTTILIPKIFDCSVSAIFVSGQEISPYAHMDNLILFESKFTSAIEQVSRFICVCILEDGRAFVRLPSVSEDDGSHSLRFTDLPPITGIRIERASPVLSIVSRRGYRLLFERHMRITKKVEQTLGSQGD